MGPMTKQIKQDPNALGTCARCRRERRLRFLIERRNYSGKIVLRCRKRSVCHSIAKRVNPQYRQSVQAFGKRAPRP